MNDVSQVEVHGGVIAITYDSPVESPQYIAGEGVTVSTKVMKISNKRTILQHTLTSAPYNADLKLLLKKQPAGILFTFNSLPAQIDFHTRKEQISVESIIPAEGSSPTPESMDNQLVIQFRGNVIGSFKQGENIAVEKMDVVKLNPEVKGYYRWNSPSQLAFNFTEDRPQFNTTYHFDINVDKLIHSETQEWVDEKAAFDIVTASNEVFVKDVSLRGKVHWQAPLRIEFSGNMVGALDVLKVKSQGIVPINISPKTDGTWRWVNARTIEFTPDQAQGWPTRNTVNVSVLPQINLDVDRSWRGEDEAHSFSFYVLPREQSISSYNLRGANVALGNNLEVRFSRAMYQKNALPRPIAANNKNSLAPLLISPAIDGEFVWASPEKLVFHPKNLWSQLKVYTVTLNPKFNPDTRYEWTGIDKFSFKTVENLVTYNTYFTPENRISIANFFSNTGQYKAQQTIKTESRLWIFFDQEIGRFIKEGEDMSERIGITPPVKGSYTWLSHQLLEFVPDNNWHELTDYQVTLKKSLLHHPEQHFKATRGKFSFSIGKNLVNSSKSIYTAEKPQTQAVEQPMTIDFSKNMNPVVKVGKSYKLSELGDKAPISISPAVDVSLQWKDKRTLHITPATYWAPETFYKIQLKKELLPQSESQFAFTPSIYSRTGKNIVQLSAFTPTGQIGKRIIIDAVLDKNIKPKSLALGSQDPYALFSISPELEGKWIWLANNKLQFTPDKPLASSTEYSVQLNPNNIPDKQFSWQLTRDKKTGLYPAIVRNFHTPALHVKHVNARFEFNEKDLLKQRFYLDINLSEPVKASELRKRFSIWFNKAVNGKNVEVPLLYTLKNRTGESEETIQEFSVVSDWIERPATDRQIHYKIMSGLEPIHGNLKMTVDYASTFSQEKPKHIRILSQNWQWQGKYYAAILALSSPVDPEKLKQFLAVLVNKEELKGIEVAIHNGNSGKFNYLITGKFNPELHYQFNLAEGLLAVDGAFTPDTVSSVSKTPALNQKLAFALGGSFLSKHDLNKVPFISTNFDYVNLRIEQVFANNLSHYINNRMNHSNITDVAKAVYNHTYKLETVTASKNRNKEITTHIDMRSMFKKNQYGLYQLTVTGSNASGYSGSMSDSRWFLSTDIGLVSRRFNNQLVIWANSLHTNAALADINIECYDVWNQVIASVKTDANGFARIKLPANNNITHIVAKSGGDMSFLDLRTHQESLSGYDVEGVSSRQSVLRSFIYSDRGVYRPGDNVHLVSVTRQKEGKLPTNYPVTFRLTNPVGKHEVTEAYQLDSSGAYIYDFAVPDEAATGKWQATALWQGKTVGQYTFQVEEFIPNKIKVEIEQAKQYISAGEELQFKVKGRNLFGPPAANRQVNASVSLRAKYFKPKGYEKYKFGHEDIKFQRIDTELLETKLNEQGEFVYSYHIPEGISSPIGLAAHYSATVIDDGGRGVSSYGSTDIHLFPQFVGVRKLSKNSGSIGKSIGFETVNVTASGEGIARNQQQLSFKVYLNKEITHYRKNERGHFRYVREKTKMMLAELGDPRDEQGKLAYIPEYAGDHILEVTDLVGGQVSRHHFFVTGPESSTQKVMESDKVELRILTGDVKAGGTVKLEVRSPFPGKVLLVGEREKVLFTKVLTMDTKAQTVEFVVPASYLPNFYISATAIRAVPEGDRNDPIYATGLVNVQLRDMSHTPDISLTTADRISPNGTLKVHLKVSDTNHAEMYFTVAAVDVGILELTKFKLPSMTGFFNHKRRLEVGHHSMYPMVMPYEPEVKYQISPSGDAPSRGLIKKKRVNPTSQKRVKSVALWSGLLKLNEQGEADVSLHVPDYDGTLRVMAVAFGKQRFASAQKEVLVRDKLVVKPTLPRFLATGDTFSIPIKLFNGTEKGGDVRLTLETTEHVKLLGSNSKTISLTAGGEQQVSFAAQVMSRLGAATVDIVAEGIGETTRKQIILPVRTPGTLITLTDNGTVDAQTPKSISLPERFVEGSQQLAMKISARPLDRFSNSLSWLLRYPHGCLEQTTSKVFPLLYYGEMVDENQNGRDSHQSRYFLKEGIEKIGRMQLSNGGFSYWEGGSYINDWAFVYASHFLVEAQKSGWVINKDVWNNMLFYLNQSVSKPPQSSQKMSHYLYGLYILSRAGENVLSRINQVYDNHLSELQAHDKARLAVAFFESGVPETANKIMTELGDTSSYQKSYRQTGGNFASNVRDLAIILDAWTTINPKSMQVSYLAEMLMAQRRGGSWGTTQENSFALLALGKAFSKQPGVEIKLSLGDGSKRDVKEPLLLTTPELLAGEVRIEVTGPGRATFSWEAVGIDKAPTSLQEDKGIKVRRRFLNREGKVQSLDSIKQGDLIVVELKMKALNKILKNVVITDLLPMGLEIENFRLSTSASLPWVRSDIKADHVDLRDDRINIFLTVPTQEKTYYYTTRAVTVGNFVVPAVRAEAMYDPEIFSESGSGKMKVELKEGRAHFGLSLQ